MWRKFSAKPMFLCKLLPRVSHYAILASYSNALNTIVSFPCPIPPSLRVSRDGPRQ